MEIMKGKMAMVNGMFERGRPVDCEADEGRQCPSTNRRQRPSFEALCLHTRHAVYRADELNSKHQLLLLLVAELAHSSRSNLQVA